MSQREYNKVCCGVRREKKSILYTTHNFERASNPHKGTGMANLYNGIILYIYILSLSPFRFANATRARSSNKKHQFSKCIVFRQNSRVGFPNLCSYYCKYTSLRERSIVKIFSEISIMLFVLGACARCFSLN